MHGFLAAQGLQGFFAAQGLHGLQAFLAAHGLHGLHAFLAAHGLHGLQAFLAAHGLHFAATCACLAWAVAFDWTSGFVAALVCALTSAKLPAIAV